MESGDLSAQKPEEVRRLQALQNSAWNPAAH
jgi:hypothetical protein